MLSHGDASLPAVSLGLLTRGLGPTHLTPTASPQHVTAAMFAKQRNVFFLARPSSSILTLPIPLSYHGASDITSGYTSPEANTLHSALGSAWLFFSYLIV